MTNTVNYVEQFRNQLEQKYERELLTSDLTDNGITFVGTQTVKIPRLILGGYKEHGRSGGWNRQDLTNTFEIKTLNHDRDVEFFVDAMDVDETNQVLSAANITNTFETEQAIPETDLYRFSKMHADYTSTFSKTVDETVLSEATVLSVFDNFMEEMDEEAIPTDGRILYVTPAVNTMLKNAESIQRTLNISGSNDNRISRSVYNLDDVKIVVVPSGRLKTEYDFTSGFAPAASALQINMILVHPRSIIAVDKHSAIRLWAPGQHTQGDGYLYQNRKYGDLFIIENKIGGVKFNVEKGV